MMYGNYLLNPRAIRAVLIRNPGDGWDCGEEEVQAVIDACMGERKFFMKDGRELPRDPGCVYAADFLQRGLA
jgi:hypothetical protein